MHSGPQLVGENVRRLRYARGLSLVELGRYAGLAKGTLTQIEAGRGNPTVDTLQALARALGATLADLVAAPEDAGERIVRADEGVRIVAASALAGRLIHRAQAGSTIFELYEWRLTAGATQRSDPHPPGVTEQVFVVDGTVAVGPEDAPLELGPRDFARYDADVPHIYRALDGRVHALGMVIFPALPSGLQSVRVSADAPPILGAPPARPAAREPTPLPPRPALPQPPVRGQRPTTRPPAGPAAGRPKPPGPGR